MIRARIILSAAALGTVLVLAPAAHAVDISGRVLNATTGKPVADQSVNLVALRGQMVPVRDTVTAADGSFRFVVAANPSERFLVQVPFRGVNYNKPALLETGDRITVDIEVYETGARPEEISVEAQTILLEPHPDHMRINEFYALRNVSEPKRTYAPDAGSFRFTLPGLVGDLQVSAARASGMQLKQQPQETDQPNTYAINFPLYPGETEIQVSYVLPLSGTEMSLRLPLIHATSRRHLAAPRASVEVQGTGLKEIEQTQVPQARVYRIESDKELNVKIKVNPAALEAAEAAAQAAPAAPEASEGGATVTIVPQPANQAQWYIVGLTLAVLLLGLFYLYSLPPVPAAGTADPTTHASARSARASK
ncbi:MAG TPA: carboxypeptidase-like regulatory domain-containing protein [Candidatus Acidoferrales bacterium]|nr:carboxypeptidase-like regulatory domain-containing protein [Candidatus Acidoferrales bacterium]